MAIRNNYISHTSVIIVGAGPTGLMLGNLLGMAGVETLMLERNAGLSDCPKAIALDDEGLRVCQALGIPMLGTTFAQKWLVVDCVQDEDHVMAATFFCNPGRPAVTVPAPHKGRRWEFMLLAGEQEEELLRTETVRALIQQNGGPDGPHIIRQAIYTFHAVLAKTFSQGRVFLLGDAAHLMPPFGGQGMNCGLREAHNLGWKLAMALREQASPALLDTYHVERHAHTAQMIWLSNFLGSIVMPTARPAALLRDMIFHGLDMVPTARKFLTEGRLKPPPRYKKGFMLPRGGRQNKAMAGLMLPQPEVVTPQGERVLLDEVLGPGFALLRLYDNPAKAFASLRADFWKRLGVRFVCVQPGRYTPTGSEECVVVGDVDGEMSKFLRHNQQLFVLVRPDRYIFGVLRGEQANIYRGDGFMN